MRLGRKVQNCCSTPTGPFAIFVEFIYNLLFPIARHNMSEES